jgi:hypothetical protein
LPTRTGAPAATAWPLTTRIAFRFAFCLLMPYALCCGHKTLFSKVPFLGQPLEHRMELAFLLPARWLAVHLFHLIGPAAVFHGTAFGDRALDWIAAGLMLVLALLATVLWSCIDELPQPRRLSYPLLFQVMRWTLRMTLVISILWYGAIKVFPIQIESPSLAVLNERVGDTSPMTMLWTVLGMNHSYERVCGAVETLCALLLLFRRTALAGALLAIVIMTNVVLFDVFFEVPVRLYASALLLMALTLIAPDLQAMLRFYFTREPATPAASWGLSALPKTLRNVALAFEVFVFLTAFKPIVSQEHEQANREASNQRHPAAIAGQWHVDNSEGTPLRGGSGALITDVFLEPSGRVNLRSADRRLWGGGRYDANAHTLSTVSALRETIRYTIAQPDANHLVLTPESGESSYPTLGLSRVSLPAHYPLLDRLHERGLHLVEEWGFER